MKTNLFLIAAATVVMTIAFSACKKENVNKKTFVNEVTLNKSSATLIVSDTEVLEAILYPANATNSNVTWSSDDDDVATVEDGLVTAVAPGTAIITVETEDGNYAASCTVTVVFFIGDGMTEATAYQIGTAKQLATLAELVNNPATHEIWANVNVYYKLIADIDLNVAPYNTGTGWVPIRRNDESRFRAYFDGDGHKVSGLMINDNTLAYTGLFGRIDGGTIKNLGIVNANINGGQNTGGLVGTTGAVSVIENCYVTGIVSVGNNTGGITGVTGTNSNVSSCYVTATVNGNLNVGGVAGYNAGILTNCYTTGAVSGNGRIGGVVGITALTNSITKCYATGTVSGNDRVGGIVGWINGSTGNVADCVALNSSVERYSGSTSTDFGRVAGFSTGILSGNVARNDMEVLGSVTTDSLLDGTGINLDDAKKRMTYEALDWDFTTVWTIQEGTAYPRLKWE